jgi:hypothetical protein
MVIGIRVLQLRGEKRNIDIPIRILAPEDNGKKWICRFEIEWPEGKAARWGIGGDAIEALFHALQMIGIEIYGSDHHRSGRLMWLAESTGYGFPVTKNIRDLLVGDDKRYL